MKAAYIKHILFLSALIIIGVSLYIRFAQVGNYNFPFTTDQARDMLDIRNIVVGKNITLIGPTTSINGVFLGPSYYYFNVLPFFVGNGDPAYLVYWNIIWYAIASIVFFAIHWKKDLAFGFFSSVFFIMAPGFFQATRYFWNSNSMPYLVVFYFISLVFFLKSPNYLKALLTGLLAGICLQFQAAFGILLLPFALLMGGIKKVGIKNLTIQISAFLITLLPQVVFELRHGFIMTKVFIAEVTGEGKVLGDKLGFFKALTEHKESYIKQAQGLIALPFNLDLVVLIAAISFLLLKMYQNRLSPLLKLYTQVGISFLMFSFIFYSFYHYGLKDWFILSLRVPYLIIIAAFFASVYQHVLKNPRYKYSPAVMALLLLFVSIIYSVSDQSRFIISANERSNDKSNLRNELQAIDWVYSQVEGKGFKAYNYIPSVYDFPYQYLYWWYATPKYGYQPETITYRDDVPEYVTNNNFFLTKTKNQQEGLIAMIYEDDENTERRLAWGGNFTQYCSVKEVTYNWGTTAEIRHPCTNEEKFLIEPQLKSQASAKLGKIKAVACFIKRDNQVLLQSKEYGEGNIKWNGILGFGGFKDKIEDILFSTCFHNFRDKTILPSFTKMAQIEYPELQLNAFVFNDVNHLYQYEKVDGISTKLFDINNLPLDYMWPDHKDWVPKILKGKLLKLDGNTTTELKSFN